MLNVKTKLLTAMAVVASFSAPMAFASTESEAAMDTISSEATALLGKAWPVVILIVTGVIGIKLFRKFANKAT